MSMKSMLLIVNPVAGQGTIVSDFFDIVDSFSQSGFEVTAYPTTGPRHAHEITRKRAADFDYLVCSGGDGTLNEVVSALMLLEKRPLLGYIPSGSVNDFATTHGLASDASLGVQTVVEGRPIAVDVGRFQNGFFTYVAAFGLFTDVSYGTPQSLKNMFGHAAYILEGVKKLAQIRHWRCRIELEDEVIEDDFIFGMISNSKSVGRFNLPSEMNIRLDDGMFELVLLRRINSPEALGNVIAALLGGKGKLDSYFVTRSVNKAKVICDEGLSWTTDGEFGGSFQVTEIAVRHKAIEIIVLPDGKNNKRRVYKPSPMSSTNF